MIFLFLYLFVFFFKQKTAYEMRISDWSSDVCSSDLKGYFGRRGPGHVSEYYRITRNAFQHDGSGSAGPERFQRFGLNIGRWRRSGRHILLCPPGEPLQPLMRVEGWLKRGVGDLRLHTARPIGARTQPRRAAPTPLTAEPESDVLGKRRSVRV